MHLYNVVNIALAKAKIHEASHIITTAEQVIQSYSSHLLVITYMKRFKL